MNKYLNITFIMLLFIALTATASDHRLQKEIEIHEVTIDHAMSLGLVPELGLKENNRGHVYFILAKIEEIQNRKVTSANIELFSYGQSITSYFMSNQGTNGKDYFYASINRNVVDSVVISIFCKNRNIYKFSVNLSAL